MADKPQIGAKRSTSEATFVWNGVKWEQQPHKQCRPYQFVSYEAEVPEEYFSPFDRESIDVDDDGAPLCDSVDHFLENSTRVFADPDDIAASEARAARRKAGKSNGR